MRTRSENRGGDEANVMETWTGSVALVTGASVGIGAAIARLLVENGMTVIGCARNVSKIDVRQHVFHKYK